MRILVVSEYHILNTGYATYYKNICNALHNAGHSVYELACYGNYNIPEHVSRAEMCPWTVYLNIPKRGTNEWVNYENSKKIKQDTDFGSWNFENIVLDCLPDVIIAIRDHWYDKFIVESPLSSYYNIILCPTVDSRPLKAEWLYTYSKVNALTSYNKWSENWLRTQYNGKNIVNCINPGVKPQFRPLNKSYVRKFFGINENDKIILTVMRNQGRKKFPELFEVLSNLEDKSIKLHCHTHFEDRGWDLIKLGLQSDIFNRILFTYKCTECFSISIDIFNKNKTCKKCNNKTNICSVQDGISDDEINLIYNNCDIYIQWHSNEGLGFPPIEAAATGKRVITVNFSAQEDVVQNINGIPIEPLTLQREINSLRLMAIPNNNELVKLLNSKEVWNYDSSEISKTTKSYYSWENAGNEWVKLVESIKPKNSWRVNKKYNSPPAFSLLKDLSNYEFVQSCIMLVAQQPDLLGSFVHLETVDSLDNGYVIPIVDIESGQKSNAQKNVTKEIVYNKFLSLLDAKMTWEDRKNKRIESLK